MDRAKAAGKVAAGKAAGAAKELSHNDSRIKLHVKLKVCIIVYRCIVLCVEYSFKQCTINYRVGFALTAVIHST